MVILLQTKHNFLKGSMVGIGHCPRFFFPPVIHTNQRQTGNEYIYFSLGFHTTVHHWKKQGGSLKQTLGGTMHTGSLLSSCPVTFLIQPWLSARDGTTYRVLGRPLSVKVNRTPHRHVHRPITWRKVDVYQIEILSSQVCHVDSQDQFSISQFQILIQIVRATCTRTLNWIA